VLMAMVFMVGLVMQAPGSLDTPMLSAQPGVPAMSVGLSSYPSPLTTHSQGRVLLSVGDSEQSSKPLDRKQVFLVVLLEHFCRTLETSPRTESSLFNMLCRKLYSLGILDTLTFLDDMDGLRLQYEQEFGGSVEFGPSHDATQQALEKPASLEAHKLKLLAGQVAQANENALILPGFFKHDDYKVEVEVDQLAAQSQLILCPEAKLLHHSPLVKKPVDPKSAEENAKALISLVLPESSVASMLHPASQLSSDSDDMYEVQCAVSNIRKLTQTQEHFEKVHVAMTALDRLVASSPAAA